MDYHDNVEEAEEVKPTTQNADENNKQDEKLLDIDYETKDILGLEGLDLNSDCSKNGVTESTSNAEYKELDQLFENFGLDNVSHNNTTPEANRAEFNQKHEEQRLTTDIFDKSDTNFNLADFSSLEEQSSREQSLQSLASENIVLLNDILGDKQPIANDWEALCNDTFLPPNILRQSLGDAALGVAQKSIPTTNTGDKVSQH